MKLYYMKEELPAATTLSETTIDEEIRQGRFPKPRQLAGRHGVEQHTSHTVERQRRQFRTGMRSVKRDMTVLQQTQMHRGIVTEPDVRSRPRRRRARR